MAEDFSTIFRLEYKFLEIDFLEFTSHYNVCFSNVTQYAYNEKWFCDVTGKSQTLKSLAAQMLVINSYIGQLQRKEPSSSRSLQVLSPTSMSVMLICNALNNMKCGKAAGPSDIIAETLKAAGEEGVELSRQLTECVFSCGVLPAEWDENIIPNLHQSKGRGKALDHGYKHGLNSQIKSWSCRNGIWTPTAMR